jgi:hypothetical protein
MGKRGLPHFKCHPLFRLILYITHIYNILQEDNIKMAVKEIRWESVDTISG